MTAIFDPQRYQRRVSAVTTFAVLVTFVFFAALAYWQVFRSDIASSQGNPRLLADFARPGRGRILDRDGNALAETTAEGTRVYHDASLAHVVGYLSARYGTQGAELAFNGILSGSTAGSSFADALNAEFRRDDPKGEDIRLTINPALQAVAVKALAGRRGALVAIDPRTGEVLAMVSNPTFDPNTLEIDGHALLQDPASPLLNRATQGLFPPGSTFKVVTAISVLENNVIKPDTQVTCPGEIVIDGFPISCRNVPQGVGTYPFRNAFVFSVNAIFGQVGDKLGWERLLATARKLGFDSAIPFTTETSRTQVFDDGAQLTRPLLASTAFGQGQLLATPLQMAQVAAAIANNGVLAAPHLGLDVVSNGKSVHALESGSSRRVISADVAATVKEMMVGVVDNAQANGVAISGVKIGGKTGTAESGRGTSHAWFIAFAPAENPVIAIAVVVEDGGQGGVVASPIAGTVIRAALGK